MFTEEEQILVDLFAKATSNFIADSRTTTEMVSILAEHQASALYDTPYHKEFMAAVLMDSLIKMREMLDE